MIDVVQGQGPAPSLVLSLVQRLPEDSLTAALASGGRHYFGWTGVRSDLANLFDAIMLNTKATGYWDKGKVPTFPPAPRPTTSSSGSADTDTRKPRVSVRDLYQRFTGGN